MRLDFWNRRECDCAPLPEPVKAEERVCRMSPARLLANSLTDPETRGEWVREDEQRGPTMMYGRCTVYRNAKRDLTLSSWWSGGFGHFSSGVRTPFTLSKAEEKLVKDALDAFDRRKRDEVEAKALSRLTAPREGLKPVRGETPKSGSPAKPRKPGPKGRAQ